MIYQAHVSSIKELCSSTYRGHVNTDLKSTLNAVSFYEHIGFTSLGESVHELQGGETLPCMQMTKRLV